MRVHGRFVVPFAGAVCIGGWVACEAVEFARPSDAACKVASGAYRDLGPPENCDAEPGQHGRTILVTSLAAGSTATLQAPMWVYVAFDPEHGVAPEPWSPRISQPSS